MLSQKTVLCPKLGTVLDKNETFFMENLLNGKLRGSKKMDFIALLHRSGQAREACRARTT